MNAFHVIGGVLTLWAVILSGLGVMSDSFPKDAAVERLVAGITILLVGGAISAAIITAGEEKRGGEAGGEAAALLP